MAEEAAIDECQPVAFGMQCHSLSQACGVVLDGDVLERNLAALDLQRESAEGPHAFTRRGIEDIRMVVPRDNGVVAVFAANLNVGEPLRDDEFLLVRAFLDEDDLVVLHKRTAHFDGLVDVAEFARAVASHKERVGVVVTFSLCNDNPTDCTDKAD